MLVKQFANPSAEYRDAPFWSWNCKLNEEELRRQIRIFKEMGMGGFFMHPRVGLNTPYLSKEFLDRVADCIDEAKKNGILAYLYDEDRWPSGTAGGMVTCHQEYQARYLELRFTPETLRPEAELFLQSYLFRQNEKGELLEYRRCPRDIHDCPGFTQVWCYRVLNEPLPRFNDTPYVDTLNPRAIRAFLDATHEKYKARFKDEFGKTIPAIFTDEPQMVFPQMPVFAQDKANISIPYTDDFPETYMQRWNADFFATLPEIFWDLPEGRHSPHRYRYHEHVAERFAEAFADTIGKWCQENGIVSTGHLMLEPRLESQTRAVGEAMRSYRSFQMPGIDLLCDDEELSTAKQAQSAARQYDRKRVLSELDGVTDWDFPFSGHKGQGDWQAALGVNMRVPHLAWLSMAGEAKRDYPSPIGPQAAWHQKYNIIAQHFARLNVALSQGKALCRIAVIHPIESYWLLYGPKSENALKMQQAEDDFAALFQWLLKGLLDFDLLCEALLPEQNVHCEGASLWVGAMQYQVVLVPPSITLRSSTLAALEDFRHNGGTVIFAGQVASICDALPSTRASELAASCIKCDFNRQALLEKLEPWREVNVLLRPEGTSAIAAHKTDGTPISGFPDAAGSPAQDLLYQLRECEDGSRILFIANTRRTGNASVSTVLIKGKWQLENMDTSSGEITPLLAEQKDGWTRLPFDFYPHGHLLLRMYPAPASTGISLPHYPIANDFLEPLIATRVPGRQMPFTLDEPNALMLDMPECRIDDAPWQPAEEILRLDNQVRMLFGLPFRQARSVQPWVHQTAPRYLGKVELRYAIECRSNIPATELAMEQPQKASILLDGTPIPFNDNGYWIDPCLRKCKLPSLSQGLHTLSVIFNYDTETCLERIYILGAFGVIVEADRCVLDTLAPSLHWGDIAIQGLPFYGGNLTYHTSFTIRQKGKYCLRLPSRLSEMQPELSIGQARREADFTSFKGALVEVALDGNYIGDIAFAPYSLELDELEPGERKLDLKLFCTRINGCGAVHLSHRVRYSGPASYRTLGNHFSYEYVLQAQGILRSPLIVHSEH
ncbi:MAG: hypothetical protein J5746_07815 [Victivallales bacterium]|nr:hypothetical protein [Victivallales bacterium]